MDQKVTFEGQISDAEDAADALTVLWESDIDGPLSIANQPNSSGRVDGAAYLSEGEHYIRLTAEDSSGKQGSDNVVIMVGPPNSPQLLHLCSAKW